MVIKQKLSQINLESTATLSFWKERLAEIEPLDLSFLKLNSNYNLLDNTRQHTELSTQESYRMAETTFNFEAEVLLKLDKLANKYKIRPYLFGQSILANLLNKYTRQDRFCISHPIVTKEGEYSLYGTHINNNITLYNFGKIYNIIDIINQSEEPLKSLQQEDLNYGLPMSEFLSFSNVDLLKFSFVHINLEYSEDQSFDFDNIKYRTSNIINIPLTTDLVFEQEIGRREINYRIRYNASKINSNLLSEFIDCYKCFFRDILNELLDNESSKKLTPVCNYTLLSANQYEKIIHKWNDLDKTSLREKTFNELFEEQAEKTPENIAVIHENTRINYKDLNEKANRLASYLKQNYTITPDILIAICLDRNEYILIAILAILKAGAAYVPINPIYPNDRVSYILKDTNATLILTNELHKKRLEKICKLNVNNSGVPSDVQITESTDILAIDNLEFQKHLCSLAKVSPNISLTKSNNLIYVIYTSGTTGKPKGVMIEHRSFISTIDCMKNLYFPNKQELNTYNIANYAFDMVGPEYGLPLLTGGTVFIGNNEFDLLDCSNYDFIQMTPTLCDLKLHCLINTSRTKLFIGAESLGYDLLVKILNKSIDVVHVYGPTETTVWSTSKYYSCDEDRKLLSVHLGKPFDNEKVYVLDNHLNPLPVGAIGEIYIGGIGLARGYLNKPDLTSEKFIPNPFQTTEEKVKNKNLRLYKSGDLGRWLPDGNLEYIGRNDFQVKIRGHRIELGEIENNLSSYEGINQSIVLAKERLSKNGKPTGHKYLIAYYVSDHKLEDNKVLDYLHSRLPDYMVPNFLIHLFTLPQTINGKLDRRALPEPEFTLNDDYIAPKNELEKRLITIWAEVIGLSEDKLGIDDDFFKLGGDSILAIRLVGKINNEFNAQISVRQIFELRCISKLSIALTSTNHNKETKDAYVPFSLVDIENYRDLITDINLIEDIYPASYLQIEMLLQSQLDDNASYHIISNFSVQGKYNHDKLMSILKDLFNKHELLRAAFISNNDSWKVVVYKSIEIDYQIHNTKNSKHLIANEKLNNFDYSKPGLIRIIINERENNFDLIFSFHHAIEDGWSMASFINELGQAYINNKPIEKQIDLRYAEFIQNELAAIENQDIKAFWIEYLADINFTKVNWKSDKEKTEDSLYNSYFSLSNEQVKFIHKISRELEISVDSIFLLAYLKILSSFTSSSDVTVGWVVSNRLEKEGGDKLFGLFLNIIPFRFRFKDQENELSELLDIFNNKLKLQKYKELPYGYIKSLFKDELYDFVFNFVHLHILSERADGIESIDGYERTNQPFTLTVAQKGDDAFFFQISVHDDYISKEFLDHFTICYKKCLANILKELSLREQGVFSC